MLPTETVKESIVFELTCKLGGMLLGGGGIIAVVQTAEIKDWVSIILGIITGACLIATTLHGFLKDKKRKKK